MSQSIILFDSLMISTKSFVIYWYVMDKRRNKTLVIFVYSRWLPFICSIKRICNFFDCNIFVHLWFIFVIGVFCIFYQIWFFITWFLVLRILFLSIFNSTNMGISFAFIITFPISQKNFFSVVLNHFFFLYRKILFLFLRICWTFCWSFFPPFFFYYRSVINWCYLIFSFNFSCFHSFQFDTLTHFIKYDYYSSLNSCGPPHMAVQKQDDQHEHTFSNYVRIRDVVQKTCLR